MLCLLVYYTQELSKGAQKKIKKKLKKPLDKLLNILYNKDIVKERKQTKMERIDRRIDYKVVMDTETCPIDTSIEGVCAKNMWTYDIGWAIVDKRGKVYRTRSFIVADIFLEEKDLMNSAYYSNKIPQYWEDIKNGKRTIKSWYNIRKIFLSDLKEFEINQVYAHNMRFDYHTITTTQKWLTKSKYRYFFPKNVEICDTLKMARDVIGKMPTYIQFCEYHGFLTKNGKPQFKAETLYRFISNDVDFIESHTALEDVMIEKEILAYCYKQHKKMRRKLWERG